METESSPIHPLGQVTFGAGNVFANWGCGKGGFCRSVVGWNIGVSYQKARVVLAFEGDVDLRGPTIRCNC